MSSPSTSSSSPGANEDSALETFQPFQQTATTVIEPARSLTPQNDHLNAAAPGELSPPRSQPTDKVNTGTTSYGTTNGASNVAPMSRGVPEEEEALDGPVDMAAMSGQPGAGWKSKRAQEEWARALEGVVDRDFSIREFGDVLMPASGAGERQASGSGR